MHTPCNIQRDRQDRVSTLGNKAVMMTGSPYELHYYMRLGLECSRQACLILTRYSDKSQHWPQKPHRDNHDQKHGTLTVLVLAYADLSHPLPPLEALAGPQECTGRWR